ncbi:prephenate dehydrogenase/arogenate dehydrogenase family protein [Halobacteriales archaeon Cl-PHB]
MQVLVVGAGEMGRWLADVLASDAPDPVTVSFADADQEVASEAAAAHGGADAGVFDPDTDETVDAVCVAVPIAAAADAIREYAPLAEAAVFDVTGTMASPVAAMAEHAPALERMSLHPLFAAANEPGNVAVVTDADGPVTESVRTALERRDNALYETTPEEHDEAMETVQAKTHAAVLAFAMAAEDVPDQLHTPISTDLANLADQVTDGESRVYADIQAAFDGAEDVAEAARRIADADDEAFAQLYEDAGR